MDSSDGVWSKVPLSVAHISHFLLCCCLYRLILPN